MNARPALGTHRIGWWLALGGASLIAVTACSTDDSADWSPARVDIGAGDVNEVSTFLRNASLSPDGRLITFVDDGEVCVQAIDESRADCVDVGGSVSEQGLGWSEDSATVVFTHDFVRYFAEPDLMTIDVETLDFDRLTDDGSDQPNDDDALIDQAPFVGPDGAIHFFRSRPGRVDFELFRIDADSGAERVRSLDLPRDTFPVGPVRQIDEDRWVLLGVDEERRTRLHVIDFANEEITELGLSVDGAALVDVDNTLVLIADTVAFGRGEGQYVLIDLDDGRDRYIDLDLEDRQLPTGAGFSPDGSSIVIALTSFGEEPSEVIAIPVDDGRADEDGAVTLLDSGDFGDLLDDGAIGLSGLGQASRIVWGPDGTLALAEGSRIVSFETTPA